MERRRPPGTEEGWYALHDLRRIDWNRWRDAPEHRRTQALEEGIDYLQRHEALEDADEGGSAVFSIVGHKADVLVLHLRPTLEQLDRAERRFESTTFAEFTERASSYVSVTEVSGYMHEDLTDGLDDIEDAGMRNYMKQRIYPTIPDADHVCFYPMDKRRDPEYNWYDLPFDERAEHMSAHGEIGRKYAGKVTQIITGSVGIDDYEWGVTLFANDLTDIKHLLYEMRFDPSSSHFAEFGPFYVGTRFPPEDLGALLAGDSIPTAETPDDTDEASTSEPDRGRPDSGDAPHTVVESSTFIRKAGTWGIDIAEYPDAGYGLLFECEADVDELEETVDGLRSNFEHYDTHVRTTVRSDDDSSVVISLWKNERAANTASGFLSDLPGADDGVGAALEAERGHDASTDDDTEDTHGGRPPSGEPPHDEITVDEFEQRISRFGVELEEHPEAGYALLFRSSTAAEQLIDEVKGLRANFEHYDTHVLTTVRADGGETAIISLWKNERAANTASGFLSDLSGADPGVGAALDETADDAGDVDTHGTDEDDDIRGELESLDIYAGKPHGEDVYAMVLYSEADPETLFEELSGLRERFDHYDTHVKSAVYAGEHGGRSAVVSIWETQEAADTAGGFLSELPEIVARAGEESGFGTMGMFYTTKEGHRDDFVNTFEDVVEAVSELDGHLDTQLLVNVEDDHDMFIASQWRAREDAMAFFRSDAFRDTVQWGREILADRPRHVFLA